MVQVVEDWQDAHEYTAELVQGPERTYTRTYFATLRHVSDDPFYIFQYKFCPQLGKHHQFDKAAYVTRVRLSQVGTSRVWKAVCEWSTNITDPSNNPNPLKRPAIIDRSSTVKDVPTFLDGKGRPRVNTAGDLIVGMRPKPFQTIKIQKNVAKVPAWFDDWPGSVNKSTVTIETRKYKPRTLKLLQTEEPHKTLENGTWYYPLTFTLERDPDTHDSIEPSRGFHELVPGFIIDKKGTRKTFNKKRITVGKPAEYPKQMQYLDKFGRHINLEPDKKTGGVDLSKIYILRISDNVEEDFRKLPFK